jgi:predicted CopG family antitoxin
MKDKQIDKEINGKTLKYGIKSFRISDDTYERLKKRRLKGQSWENLFKELLNETK